MLATAWAIVATVVRIVVASVRSIGAFYWSWLAFPPLMAMALGVELVVFDVGTVLGLPNLVWRESFGGQVVVGLCISVLFLGLAMTAYLLECEDVTDYRASRPLSSYLRVPLWTPPLCFAVAAITQHRPYCAGAVVSAMLVPSAIEVAAAGLWYCYGQRWASSRVFRWLREKTVRLVQWLNRWMPREAEVPPARLALLTEPDLVALQLFMIGALLGYFVLAAYLWNGPSAEPPSWEVPAIFPVCLALLGAAVVWGFFSAWANRFRFVWTIVIVAVILVAGGVSDHELKDFQPARFEDDNRAPDPGSTFLSSGEALTSWREHVSRLSGEQKPKLVVVATSGGGIRAAAWTAYLLMRFERCMPDFTRHIRVITGASGGMVGAAHFIANVSKDHVPGKDRAELDHVMDMVTADSLSAVVRDLVRLHGDRTDALEMEWLRRDPKLDVRFGCRKDDADARCLKQGEQEGWRPSLVFSPMMVEDGRRLIISNLDLAGLFGLGRRTSWTAPGAPCSSSGYCAGSRSALQLFDIYPRPELLKLSTAAVMNAAFPWVTAATRLPLAGHFRRVVDAGYYDNFGVDIASLWLAEQAAWLRENTSGVMLVQIRDQAVGAGHPVKAQEPGPLLRQASPLVTPIAAEIAARTASMVFRNDEMLELLAEAEDPVTPPLAARRPLLETTLFELDADVPLSWSLSTRQREDITKSLNGGGSVAPGDHAQNAVPRANETALGLLHDWWSGHPPTRTPLPPACGAP